MRRLSLNRDRRVGLFAGRTRRGRYSFSQYAPPVIGRRREMVFNVSAGGLSWAELALTLAGR